MCATWSPLWPRKATACRLTLCRLKASPRKAFREPAAPLRQTPATSWNPLCPEPMRAMALQRQVEPLRLEDVTEPQPGPGQVLISVSACGVCRTDLHIVDGDLDEPKLPLIPGHPMVGTEVETGGGAGGDGHG